MLVQAPTEFAEPNPPVATEGDLIDMAETKPVALDIGGAF
jgi:hypothetical protein